MTTEKKYIFHNITVFAVFLHTVSIRDLKKFIDSKLFQIFDFHVVTSQPVVLSKII